MQAPPSFFFKVICAGAAAVVAAGVIGELMADDDDELVAAFVLDGAFYQRREGARFILEPPEQADRGVMKWVWVDDTHWRWEVEYLNERMRAAGGFAVADGEYIRIYEGTENWHFRIPIAGLKPEWIGNFSRGAPGPFAILPVSDIDAYVATRNDSRGADSYIRSSAHRVGSDSVLGHAVEFVESTPSWANGESRTSGGVVRQWIEPTHMLVVKSTSEGNDGTEASRAEVTRLSFRTTVDTTALEFKPPKGSCDMGVGTPHPPNGTSYEDWRREKCGR